MPEMDRNDYVSAQSEFQVITVTMYFVELAAKVQNATCSCGVTGYESLLPNCPGLP